MCDSGSRAHPLDLAVNIPNVCVDVYAGVGVCGTWELGAALLRQVDDPGCVDWLVCEFFRGLLRGPHRSHACVTHGAVSVCLSDSRAKYAVLYSRSTMLASKEPESGILRSPVM